MSETKRRKQAKRAMRWRRLLLTCTAISVALIVAALLFFPEHLWIAVVAVIAMACWLLAKMIR